MKFSLTISWRSEWKWYGKVLNRRKLLNFINNLKVVDLMTRLTWFHTLFVHCANEGAFRRSMKPNSGVESLVSYR